MKKLNLKKLNDSIATSPKGKWEFFDDSEEDDGLEITGILCRSRNIGEIEADQKHITKAIEMGCFWKNNGKAIVEALEEADKMLEAYAENSDCYCDTEGADPRCYYHKWQERFEDE